MPTPTQSIFIEIGGKTRHLRYDWSAFEAADAELGANIFDIMDKAGSSLSFTQVKVLLWAGLLHEDKALTIDEVVSWLSPRNYVDLVVKISQAVAAAWTGDDDEKNATSQVEIKKSSPGKTT